MRRVEASGDVEQAIKGNLIRIEETEGHDKNKVEKSLKRLRNRGGVDLHLGDHFEIKKMSSGDAWLSSPTGAKQVQIGKPVTRLDGDMYIVGRESEQNEIVYYKISGSEVAKRECGMGSATVSRFDLAIIPSGDRVEIFNIGKNPADLYFEGEVEF